MSDRDPNEEVGILLLPKSSSTLYKKWVSSSGLPLQLSELQFDTSRLIWLLPPMSFSDLQYTCKFSIVLCCKCDSFRSTWFLTSLEKTLHYSGCMLLSFHQVSSHIVMLLSWYLKCCISMWTDINKPFCFIFSSKDHALQRFFRLFSLIFLFPCLVLSWFFLLFCIPLPSWFPQSTPSLFIHVEHHGWVFLFHFMLSDLETA